MTISDTYFSLLDHLGPTRPVRDLTGNEPNVVALRHDVDHDLDVALEMAFWEHRRGVRATYYLLPSAPYWADPLFEEKVMQLADYDHEVGLHLNVLAEWTDGRIDDVFLGITAAAERLRAGGVEVTGSATHGDKNCYTHGVINNWVFAELRPQNPSSQSGLSAEGIPSPDPAFRIPYTSDVIRRTDGAEFQLWSLSMAAFGLSYEAVRLPMDRYYSDSGGNWSRTPDPMTVDVSTGRHQILVHPEYYRGPQRFVFVLSTARSGSKWVAQALERSSAAASSHEYTLNHTLAADGSETAEHRTGSGFTQLLNDRDEIHQRVLQARVLREEDGQDHIESNVYLSHCVAELQRAYPDAVLIHLFRKPGVVLRSLLNREWYDTPHDDRHPLIDVEGWSTMSQVEKCAAYITAITIDLGMTCHSRISFEEVLNDPRVMIEVLSTAGIAVHDRLLRPMLTQVINANTASFVPPVEEWPVKDQLEAQRALSQAYRLWRSWSGKGPKRLDVLKRGIESETVLLDGNLDKHATAIGGTLECGRTVIFKADPERHAYILLGGGVWNSLPKDAGWPIQPGDYALLTITADLTPSATATIFGLTYDANGDLLAPRRLTPLGNGGAIDVGFRPRSDGARWNVGIHLAVGDPGLSRSLQLHSVRLATRRPSPTVLASASECA